MTDKELIQELSNLQVTRASTSLRKKIAALVGELPAMHRGFYFPLFAFQMAVVGIVLIVVIGFGSSVIVASKAQPGTPLFPIKEILHTVVPQAIEEHSPVLYVPTPTPTIAPTSTPTPQQHHIYNSGSNEKNGENFLKTALQKIQDVKGAHTEQSRNGYQSHQEHQESK